MWYGCCCKYYFKLFEIIFLGWDEKNREELFGEVSFGVRMGGRVMGKVCSFFLVDFFMLVNVDFLGIIFMLLFSGCFWKCLIIENLDK